MALAAVLGGFGVLCQAITDVQRSLVDTCERFVRVETVLELDGRAGPDDASPGAD